MSHKQPSQTRQPDTPSDAITAFAEADDLDDQTIAAINEAEARADLGEGTDLEAVRARFRSRWAGR